MSDDQPLLVFTSHIEGKNAKVSIYRDRVEWLKPRGVSGGKVTAGIMTGGLSLLATGVKNGKSGTEMIPVKSISSVATKRDGLLNTIVSVITSGNTIDFRVAHAEAAQVKETLTRLLLGTHPALTAAPGQSVANDANPPRWILQSDGRHRWWAGYQWTDHFTDDPSNPDPTVTQASPAATALEPASTAPTPPDPAAQLQQLAGLRDAGILTEEEFAAKKTEILTRM